MFDNRKILFLLTILTLVFFIYGSLELFAGEKKHLIVIDPSHGGQDTGVKLTDKINEKDVNLSIALALQQELSKENNLEVILTRNSDITLSLEERRNNITKTKPSFFLSLHINAGFSKSASGYELYYPGFDKDMTEGKKTLKGDARKAKNKYLNDSIRLAHIIQKNLDIIFPRKNRGLREADLPIIDGLSVPTLVVEIGFATNPEDKKKLLTASTQDEIAKALAKSIKSFFR